MEKIYEIKNDWAAWKTKFKKAYESKEEEIKR